MTSPVPSRTTALRNVLEILKSTTQAANGENNKPEQPGSDSHQRIKARVSASVFVGCRLQSTNKGTRVTVTVSAALTRIATVLQFYLLAS